MARTPGQRRPPGAAAARPRCCLRRLRAAGSGDSGPQPRRAQPTRGGSVLAICTFPRVVPRTATASSARPVAQFEDRAALAAGALALPAGAAGLPPDQGRDRGPPHDHVRRAGGQPVGSSTTRAGQFRKFVKTARRYRTIEIQARDQRQHRRRPATRHLRDVLNKISNARGWCALTGKIGPRQLGARQRRRSRLWWPTGDRAESWSGGIGGDGDVEAERLYLPDVVAELAAGVGAGLVVAAAEVGEPGLGVTEQVADDDQD